MVAQEAERMRRAAIVVSDRLPHPAVKAVGA
jgi:hypothetical protein